MPLSRLYDGEGKPVSELMSKDRLEAIVKRTREGAPKSWVC